MKLRELIENEFNQSSFNSDEEKMRYIENRMRAIDHHGQRFNHLLDEFEKANLMRSFPQKPYTKIAGNSQWFGWDGTSRSGFFADTEEGIKARDIAWEWKKKQQKLDKELPKLRATQTALWKKGVARSFARKKSAD